MELRGLEPRSCRNFPRDSVHSDKNTSTLAAPSLQSSMTLLAQTTTPIADGWLRDLYGISIVCSLPKGTPPDSDRHGMKNCYNFLVKEGYMFLLSLIKQRRSINSSAECLTTDNRDGTIIKKRPPIYRRWKTLSAVCIVGICSTPNLLT